MPKRYIAFRPLRGLFDADDGRYAGTTVYVLPPDASELSDEGECVENVTKTKGSTISDVMGKLELEVIKRNVKYEEEVDDNQAAEENQPSQSSAIHAKRPKKMKVSPPALSWVKAKNPDFSKTSGLIGQAAALADCNLRLNLGQHSPVQLFEEFFSPEVYDLMTIETVRYSTDVKHDSKFGTSPEELKAFLGILLLSGYRKLPSETDYWSDSDDLGVPIVKSAMSRNQYQRLKSRLHFVDNTTAQTRRGDRSFKVKPLLDLLNANFHKFGYFTPNISIGEMIVDYDGGERLGRFIWRKSIRMGFKCWATCSRDGYCYDFSLYCGKETNATDTPIDSRIVWNAVQHISDPSSYTLYFDDFFTSMELLSQLGNKGFRATARIRENRINKTCPLKSLEEIRKMDIGVYDYIYERTSEVFLVRWRDYSTVTVATNYDSLEPFHDVKRRTKRQEEQTTVKMPNVISNYNAHVNGVENHDSLALKYSVSIRGHKWYWPLFTRCIDMAVVNAWILHKIINGANAMNLLEFRRAIATVYLKIPQPRKFAERPRISRLPVGAHSVRLDGFGHFLMQREKQRRCQNEGCNSKPKTYCGKCNVTLCRSCFQPYHVV